MMSFERMGQKKLENLKQKEKLDIMVILVETYQPQNFTLLLMCDQSH